MIKKHNPGGGPQIALAPIGNNRYAIKLQTNGYSFQSVCSAPDASKTDHAYMCGCSHQGYACYVKNV